MFEPFVESVPVIGAQGGDVRSCVNFLIRRGRGLCVSGATPVKVAKTA